MLCGKCQKREAKIYCTEIIDGIKKEQYLCEQCAAEYASFQMNGERPKKEMQDESLLSGLLEKGYRNEDDKEEGGKRCGRCGLSYNDFLKTGRFGCSNCYTAFGKVFDKSLKQIQGSDSHHGKIPKGFVTSADKVVENISEIDKLTLKLQYAVEKEEFEEAARLRDIIREKRNAAKEDKSAAQEEINNA
ncbi:UvrB/UvrC motif-containing protein [[Clostridium] polysaccharolyticum]|uniref:Protein-arginine kinase activator protein McsA n=1 Tax=[Clostridium] polysaccharolyticum TaxID=29364 RepID=A0A1H9YYL1_9FIRM|nr:UvrB/UvrC motif-containing protein [[Clostridium] polysaccharolyticum]SES73672.1 Protein-arginine kinase activator protein McsA [[Clostridium] polysaccharolyticum]